MSDVEAYKGKLVPVDLDGKSVDMWIQDELKNVDLENYMDLLDALYEERNGQYFYDRAGDVLYEIHRTPLDPEGFVHSTANPDGSYSFTVSYYNGGASFEEVMDEVVGN